MNCRIPFQVWVLVPLLFLSRSGYTQDTARKISLDEAIGLSIKNSKSLRAAHARVAQAAASLTIARQNQLPDLKVSGSYLRLTQPNINMYSKTGSGGAPAQPVEINQAAYAMANLSLPVFSGLRVQYGIRSSEYLEKAAVLDADRDREAVILNAIEAFSNLYKARANERVILENLAQSRSRDVDFANLEKNGLLARNDKLKALLQTANIELALADVENNMKLATVNMNIMLGLPEETRLVPDSSSLVKPDDVKSLVDYEQLALQNRKDMQAIEYRKKASQTGIKTAKADYFPSLALTSGYIAADIPNFITITNALTFGVGLSYNVASLWKTNAHVTEAKARLAEVQANEEALNEDIRRQVNQAYQALMTANKKIEVTQVSIEQGKENYKIVKNKYDNNLLTVTDLLDANVLMLQSQISYEVAKADALVAYNALLERAGILASTRNIK
ncbi:MAG TPA: TolC family protein [Chitinophagaceae bacterium]|nr:TolC family protein [Chitinophagaceae bacterium]